MKKILGLVISERNLGNSELLVKEIMNNIPEPCQFELIRLTDLKISSCKACYRCLQEGKECLIKDDFNFVMNRIKAADALIIGVPVYLLGPHGYYKMLGDRLVGSNNYAKFTAGMPCVIVVPYGAAGWTGYTKGASLVLPRTLQMKLVEYWEVNATLPGESLLSADNLNHAREIGNKLLNAPEYIPDIRECPFCGSDLYRLLPKQEIECVICNARGRLKADNIPDWSDADYCRFSKQAIEEHFKEWLVAQKKRFQTEKEPLKEAQRRYKDMDWWVKP